MINEARIPGDLPRLSPRAGSPAAGAARAARARANGPVAHTVKLRTSWEKDGKMMVNYGSNYGLIHYSTDIKGFRAAISLGRWLAQDWDYYVVRWVWDGLGKWEWPRDSQRPQTSSN